MQLEEVPVINLSGLSEVQKKARRLADDKIALNAGWDTEILKLELAELSLPEIDIDLGLTGFSPGEIDVVLAEADGPDDEVIPAVPKPWPSGRTSWPEICRRGGQLRRSETSCD